MSEAQQSTSPQPESPPESPQPEPRQPSAAEVEQHEVPALTREDMDDNVLIGVCGVQASGKTVFLTSVFHTLNGESIPGVGEVSFDREVKGGARYFERVEDQIRRRGTAIPTREPAVLRLLIEPEPESGWPYGEVGVFLFDFAGGYFTQFSDLPLARELAETPAAKRDLELVNEYLERCDALIVLVDAQSFARSVPGDHNPFPPTVTFLRIECRRRGKPLAIVLTKSDLNPDLTAEDVEQFEVVGTFYRAFTRDSAETGRPFGLVELLSCYEIDSTGDVVEQSKDGSIWRREPGEVFSKILRAAWPAATRRLRARLDGAKKRKEEEENADRRRRWWKQARWAALAAALLLAAASPWLYRNLYEGRQLDEAVAAGERVAAQLDQGRSDAIPGEDLDLLRRLSGERDDAAASASWGALANEVRESLAAVPATYPLGGDEPAATRNLIRLAEVVGIEDGAELRMLRGRLGFVERSGSVARPGAERLALVTEALDGALARGDEAFRQALESEAAALRDDVAREAVRPGFAESTLSTRAQFVRLALRGLDGDDPQLEQAIRRGHGRLLGASLAELGEREKLIQFLATALPALRDLLSVPDLGSRGVLEYRLVRSELTKVRPLDEAKALYGEVSTLLAEMAGREESLQRLLAATFEDLHRDLEPEAQRGVWAELLAGADSEYFFILRDDAWPDDLRPWLVPLRAELANGAAGANAARVIEQLARRPLYWSEIQDIAELSAGRYLEVATATIYRQCVGQLERGARPSVVAFPLRSVVQLAESLDQEHARIFDRDVEVFERQRAEALTFAERAEAAGGDVLAGANLRRDLEGRLTAICRSRLDEDLDACSG